MPLKCPSTKTNTSIVILSSLLPPYTFLHHIHVFISTPSTLAWVPCKQPGGGMIGIVCKICEVVYLVDLPSQLARENRALDLAFAPPPPTATWVGVGGTGPFSK
jgi:hypothetical protein